MEWIIVGIVAVLLYIVLEIRHIKRIVNANVNTQEIINSIHEMNAKILAESIKSLNEELKCD